MEQPIVEQLRKARDSFIYRELFQTAIFLSDKILALSEPFLEPCDIFILAKCLYRLKEYQRAAYVITSLGLHKTDMPCCLIVIKCYLNSKNWIGALQLSKEILQTTKDNFSEVEYRWRMPIIMNQSLIYQALDNQISAKECLYELFKHHFTCYEAFAVFTKQHMASKCEEIKALNLMIENNNISNPFLCAFMKFFYYIRLKKYDKPDDLEFYKPFDLFVENTDCLIALSERHFYNFKLKHSLDITTNLLKQDIHNFECLLIHISCLMEFDRSNDVFDLAQTLINFYPERDISWYAVGCYYHLIGRIELSRRFLLKSTTLNSFFAPAWLLFGHSFSQVSEHDQAISTYFKAYHFMPGCHLPLLYIGVEYIRTDNCRLGNQFICNALSIAPDDPLVLHEAGIIAYNQKEMDNAENFFRSALNILKCNFKTGTMPNRFDTLFNNMGHVLRKLNRPLLSLEMHKKALMMNPQNPSFYSSMGLVYCSFGKWAHATKLLDRAYALYKLHGQDDTNSKTLLEDHALKQLPNTPAYKVSFLNKFNDKEYVEKLCNQTPKTFDRRSLFEKGETTIEAENAQRSSKCIRYFRLL